MKKIVLIICLLLLSGCNDYVEINDLAIITGIVIDYKDDMFDITTQLIVNEKESTIKIYNTQSNSIEEGLKSISKLCNKDLFISDLKVLIITDNIIENNINYYDFFLRNSKSKMNFYVYMSDSKTSNKIMNIYKNVDGSSLYIDKLMKFNERVFSSSTPLIFIDLVKTDLEKGINPVYPTLTIKENNDEKTLYLDNLVTYNNKKEKLFLNENESITYNILNNNIKKTSQIFKCENNEFTLKIENANTKYSFKNNIFNIDVKISSKLENYECEYDLDDKDTINKLIELSKDTIINDINNILSIMKNNKNDFLGLGKYIYKHNNKYFDFNNKIWDEYLDKLNIKIKCNMTILSTGEIRKSIGDNNGKS